MDPGQFYGLNKQTSCLLFFIHHGPVSKLMTSGLGSYFILHVHCETKLEPVSWVILTKVHLKQGCVSQLSLQNMIKHCLFTVSYDSDKSPPLARLCFSTFPPKYNQTLPLYSILSHLRTPKTLCVPVAIGKVSKTKTDD